jgi:hypothetical protein
MGYGARAIEALNSFYSGDLFNIDDVPEDMGESFEQAAKVAPVGFDQYEEGQDSDLPGCFAAERYHLRTVRRQNAAALATFV